jgi:SOS response regulatory protein OraA/RecX
MAAGTVHKHYRLSGDKIRLAQRLLGARTETEAIERALDEVIAEHERRRIVERAQERFLRSGITLQDAYGKLEA